MRDVIRNNGNIFCGKRFDQAAGAFHSQTHFDCCFDPPSGGMDPDCGGAEATFGGHMGVAFEHVKKFAGNDAAWAETFLRSWNKVTALGHNNALHLLALPGLKEEIWYNRRNTKSFRNLKNLPSFSSLPRPHQTRFIEQIFYPRTLDTWPGFRSQTRFVVRWTGYIKIDLGGHYGWCTKSNDGSILMIDDNRVVNNDGIHVLRLRCVGLSVAAGHHKIEAHFFQIRGPAAMEVRYSGADTNDEPMVIPSSKFFRPLV